MYVHQQGDVNANSEGCHRRRMLGVAVAGQRMVAEDSGGQWRTTEDNEEESNVEISAFLRCQPVSQ